MRHVAAQCLSNTKMQHLKGITNLGSGTIQISEQNWEYFLEQKIQNALTTIGIFIIWPNMAQHSISSPINSQDYGATIVYRKCNTYDQLLHPNTPQPLVQLR